ncbi:putative oxidoreductase, aryl-alcohol dehydrogenase like protein [Leptolyngbyaceae cyanobacterium JSC-12]|nr:putative oxidoreductase, aryl-alcohol dehydrogenase like protein [Leptolyngbyaceae cyanobacterium JSC-12]
MIALKPNGPSIAPLGIGTWQWGDKLFWSYGKDYGADQVRAAFFAALEAGVCFFDTAEVYGLGESERLLGQFMKETDQPVQVATKYFPLPWRFGPQAVEDTLTASLKRLQVEHIPLYQVHAPLDFLMGQRTLMNALADEVEKGRIGAIGISNYSAEQMRKAHKYLAARGIPLAVNQVRYSLLSRQIESNGIFETARELGITILAYSPLAQGLLTGKYTPESAPTPEGARRIDPRFKEKGLEKIAPLINTLKRIGETHQRTPAQVALNWLIAQGNVIPIPGAKNAEQARQNAGALGWSLSPDEVGEIEELSRGWR